MLPLKLQNASILSCEHTLTSNHTKSDKHLEKPNLLQSTHQFQNLVLKFLTTLLWPIITYCQAKLKKWFITLSSRVNRCVGIKSHEQSTAQLSSKLDSNWQTTSKISEVRERRLKKTFFTQTKKSTMFRSLVLFLAFYTAVITVSEYIFHFTKISL